ncbi:MAG: HNH endonuclease [Nitrososphaerota archaeon]|nr:HNH endonuclease [Nitrososphaerota archaeon]
MPPPRDRWIENRRHVRNYPHRRSVHIPRSTLKSLPRVCAACGQSDEGQLVVDHVNRDSLDNRRRNLRVLCRSCHRDKTPVDSPFRGFVEYDARRADQAKRSCFVLG